MKKSELDRLHRNKLAQYGGNYIDDANLFHYVGQQDGTLRIKDNSGSSIGSLTDISINSLSPLFTASVINIATTKDILFAQIPQLPNTVYAGPSSGASANPTFRPLTIDDLTMSLIISKTYAEMNTLIAGSLLQPGITYFVSDKNVYLQALTTNSLSNSGLVKATNADYNNVTTNFIGVWQGTVTIQFTLTSGWFDEGEIISGGTSGATAEHLKNIDTDITNATGLTSISTNGVVFTVGETITGLTSGSTGTILAITVTSILGTIANNKIVSWCNLHYKNITGAATIKHPKYDTTNWLALATTDSSYQIEYDPIVYNWANANITSRQDKRGNIVVDHNSAPNSIDRFQCGRNTVFENKIWSFDFTGWNACTAQDNMFIQDSGCYIGDTAAFKYSIVISRSTIRMLGASDALALDCAHANLAMYAGLARHTNLHNFGDLTMYTNTCDASDTTFIQTRTVLKGTSAITDCSIDGGPIKIQNIFNNESHSSKVYKRDVSSTFEKSLSQASGLTTLTLPLDDAGNTNIYGVYNTTITGGTATIDTIANIPAVMPVNIVMAGSNNIILVNSASLLLKGGSNLTLTTANYDWIELQYLTSSIQEINCSVIKNGNYFVKVGQQTVTTSTTYVTISDLTANVIAGGTYRIELYLYAGLDAVGGIKVKLSGGTCTSSVASMETEIISNDTGTYYSTEWVTNITNESTCVGDTDIFIRYTGIVTVGNAGTFIPSFAQSVANGSSSIQDKSFMVITKIS